MKTKGCDVEISFDGGKTWKPFGMTVSQLFVKERTYELNWTEIEEKQLRSQDPESQTAKSPD